jgi:hypothetical protein
MTKLCPPEPRSPLLLYVSASNSVVSAVLVQEKEEEGKFKQILVYFASEALSGSKLFYSELDDSICIHHGCEKVETLLRGSMNKSHHKSTIERFVRK